MRRGSDRLADARGRDLRPWYRQFWPWALIALPGSAVAASLFTLYLAVQEPDGLVVDDYYREGLAINHTLDRDRLAARLGLSAQGRIDAADGRLSLRLDGGEGTAPALRVSLLHPTRAGHDRRAALRYDAARGTYAGELGPLSAGNWYVLLEPADARWRLLGRVRLPGAGRLELHSRPVRSAPASAHAHAESHKRSPG